MALNDKDGEFDGPLTEHYSRPMFMARHGALSRMTCILPTYYAVDLSPSLRSISRLYLFIYFFFVLLLYFSFSFLYPFIWFSLSFSFWRCILYAKEPRNQMIYQQIRRLFHFQPGQKWTVVKGPESTPEAGCPAFPRWLRPVPSTES